MAGMDGIRNKIEPPKPIDKNLYELEPEEAAKVKSMPGSLDQALDALEKDHEFLLKGDVFTKDVIERGLRTRESTKSTPSAYDPSLGVRSVFRYLGRMPGKRTED